MRSSLRRWSTRRILLVCKPADPVRAYDGFTRTYPCLPTVRRSGRGVRIVHGGCGIRTSVCVEWIHRHLRTGHAFAASWKRDLGCLELQKCKEYIEKSTPADRPALRYGAFGTVRLGDCCCSSAVG